MYQRFFGMERKPFGVSPRLASYCPVPDHEEAVAALRYVVLQGAGIGLVLGQAGMGKSTVCLRLASLLDPTYAVAFVTQTNFATVKAFYQAIHYDLGLPYYGMDEQELRLSFSDFVLGRLAAGGKTVLIVDEGQNLTDRILEEIRLLADAEAQEKSLVQVILAARPALAERLADPFFGSLRQRIAITVQLKPLSLLDTLAYVRSQIRAAGGIAEQIVTDEALERIHELAEGVPRRINHLCDHAFLVAFAAEKRIVDREVVDAAWLELQELEVVTRGAVSEREQTEPADAHTGPAAGADEAIELPVDVSLGPVTVVDLTPSEPGCSDVLVKAGSGEGHELVVGPGVSDAEPEASIVAVEDRYARLDAALQGQEVPSEPGAIQTPAGEPEEDWEAVEIGPEEERIFADVVEGPEGPAVTEKDVTAHPAHQPHQHQPHELRPTTRHIFSRLQRRSE